MLVMTDCKSVKKKVNQKDNFYTQTNSSWDAIRIPLIKPYELLELNGSQEWSMNFIETPSSISKVKEINVYKDIIVIHSGETDYDNKLVDEAWFVIQPQKKSEMGFTLKDDFNKYISSQKLTNVVFYDVDSVYVFFAKNGELNWSTDFKHGLLRL